MSETLSEADVREINDRHIFNPDWYVYDLGKLVISHQALQAEREDLKDELATALKERNDLAMRCDALKAELAEAKWARGDFEQAPCFLCGYNGSGYYQPSQHACAEEYHRRKEAQP